MTLVNPKLEVYIDGACEPINPGGTASYGVVAYEGEVRLFSKSAIVGSGSKMSNNIAEYSGLIAFLEWYSENGRGRTARIYSDSQLLVNQMSGRWGVNKGLYVPYYEKALDLMTQEMFNKLNFQWVSREKNLEADKLSKDILVSHGIKVRER